MFSPLAGPDARGNGASAKSHVGQVGEQQHAAICERMSREALCVLAEKGFSLEFGPVPVYRLRRVGNVMMS